MPSTSSPTGPTRARRLVAALAALLAASTLVAGACSSDESSGGKDGKDNTTSTTEKEGGSSTTASDGSTPSSTAGDFKAAIKDLQGQLRSTDGDLCGLIALSSGISGEPKDSDEVQQAVTFTTDWLVAIAESAPETLSADAENVRNAAEQLGEAARSADYPPDFFNSQAAQAIGTPELQTSLQNLAATCGGGSGSTGSTGGSTGTGG